MSQLTGAAELARAILRRDRLRIAVWVVSLVALVWASAAGVKGLYPTREKLVAAAASIEGNAAIIAFNGPQQGIDTLGGRIVFETATFGMVVVALMSVFMLTRNTRAEEESGRLELIQAARVGRYAQPAAAMAVVAAMNVVVAAGTTLAVSAQGVDMTGSVILGLGFLAVGMVFVAVAALTSQVTDNTRVANGLAGAVLGAAFLLRAIGDVGDGTLSWLSPIGWAQKARPFAGDLWWPLLVPAAFTVAALALAAALTSRRDLGGGLVATRPGPAEAAPGLDGALGLSWRLHRGALMWWALAVFALGAVYGSVASDIEDFLADNEQLGDLLARSGADLVDSFFATTLLILAVISSGYAVQATLRLRSEETAVRAEPLLAAPLSRTRWLASHVGVATAGTVVVLVAAGAGMGLAHAGVTGELDKLGPLVVGALLYVPAVAVLVGVSVGLFGLLPRFTNAAWAALVLGLVVGFLGELLSLPTWVAKLSPFEHVPLYPAEPVEALPVVVLSVLAVALVSGGAHAFNRRDLD